MEDQLRCEKHNNEHLIDAGPQLRQLQPIGVVAILCCASMFATSASRLLSRLKRLGECYLRLLGDKLKLARRQSRTGQRSYPSSG